MLKIGVTGGIGSGKSLVCRVFTILGVPVYNADEEAGRIMNEDRDIIQRLSEEFGREVFRDGRLCRAALARLAFNDPDALELLNSIVHPAVRKDFMAWLKRQDDVPYIVKEAAILFETGVYRQLDAVILVTAPEQLRIRRIVQRDGAGEDDIRKRMASQWPDEKKAALAGVVIKNDNREPLLPLILQLHSEFSRGYLREGMAVKK